MSGAGGDTSRIAMDIGAELGATARQNGYEKPRAPRKQSNTVVLPFVSPIKTTATLLEAGALDGAVVASEPVNGGSSVAGAAS